MTRRIRPWLSSLPALALTLGGAAALSQDDPALRPAADADATSPGAAAAPKATAARKPAAKGIPKVVKSDRYWRSTLQPNQYLASRRQATETPFSGIYWNHHDDGVYACVACGTPLFDSRAKFDSGTGWPSYWGAIDRNFLRAKPDISNGQPRTEVICRVCDGHLGHVFNDGPRPTGLRFCINSASITFVARPDLPDHLETWREFVGLAPAKAEAETKADEPKDAEAETGADAPKAEAAGVPKAGESGSRPEPKRLPR